MGDLFHCLSPQTIVRFTCSSSQCGYLLESEESHYCIFSFFSMIFVGEQRIRNISPHSLVSFGVRDKLKLKMSLFTQRKIRTLTGLLCAMTFSMFVFSYTLREPSLYFFRSVLGLSGSTCSCRRCITHLDDEDDSWFMERFNQSFHPLMSRKSSMLSDDTYRWWQVSHIALLIAEQN